MFIDNLTTLTNYGVIKTVDELKIIYFKGVFMRDTPPKQIINKMERGISSLDVSKSNGIHWVCYYKNNEKCYSFGSSVRITNVLKQWYRTINFSKIQYASLWLYRFW
ncbi:MAG: hypothetical protein DI539_27145 [Flavobacterium psychrophilum]|nr:MAG: hypothetical protein DI539_27145 [Flavobacterium psychrophilum]